MTCKTHLTVAQALLTPSYSDLQLLSDCYSGNSITSKRSNRACSNCDSPCYSGIYINRTLHCNNPVRRVTVTIPNSPQLQL